MRALVIFKEKKSLLKRGSTVGGSKGFAGEREEALGFGVAAHGAADRDMGHAYSLVGTFREDACTDKAFQSIATLSFTAVCCCSSGQGG